MASLAGPVGTKPEITEFVLERTFLEIHNLSSR